MGKRLCALVLSSFLGLGLGCNNQAERPQEVEDIVSYARSCGQTFVADNLRVTYDPGFFLPSGAQWADLDPKKAILKIEKEDCTETGPYTMVLYVNLSNNTAELTYCGPGAGKLNVLPNQRKQIQQLLYETYSATQRMLAEERAEEGKP